MSDFFAKRRLLISRVCTGLIAIVIIVSKPVLQYTIAYPFMFFLGLALIILCIVGRAYSSVFMGDNRNRSVVTSGIYSITRNPLYFFSFLGILGTSLVYSSMIVMVLLVIFFSFYYSQVIKFEEKSLSQKFGQPYIDYLNSGVPRFFPKRKLWQAEEYVSVRHSVVLKTIKDSLWFFAVAVAITILLLLQNIGLIPVFMVIL